VLIEIVSLVHYGPNDYTKSLSDPASFSNGTGVVTLVALGPSLIERRSISQRHSDSRKNNGRMHGQMEISTKPAVDSHRKFFE
jgi:hypothetical protein